MALKGLVSPPDPDPVLLAGDTRGMPDLGTIPWTQARAGTRHRAMVLVLDSRKEVDSQSRHWFILARLLGMRGLVVAVRMESVGHDYDVFKRLRAQITRISMQIGVPAVHCVPVSIPHGDMLTARGDRIDWYEGPTLAEVLSEIREPLGGPAACASATRENRLQEADRLLAYAEAFA